MKYSKTPASGDPSSVQQSFEKIDLSVHCCRYWWLKKWKHQRLSFPYWRLYWNKVPGAYVFFETMVKLDPDRILLIPPYTPFYTDILVDRGHDEEAYGLEGGWINSPGLERQSIEKGYIPHFFVHFNLGYRFDMVKPGIYHSPVSGNQKELIDILTRNLMQGRKIFTLKHSLALYNLVMSAMKSVPEESWEEYIVGTKVQKALNHIDQNLKQKLSNNDLAILVHMAPNSFARLFKQQTGLTPQDFIRKKRVEHASKLLYHTDQSIKQISEECGFNDRYYFTRVFTRVMGGPPASYRKKLILCV
jgi:AraC-like DNA-binding protein